MLSGNDTLEFLLKEQPPQTFINNGYEAIFTLNVYMNGTEKTFKRQVYTLLDMIGDIGALKEGLIFLVGFLMNAYNKSYFHSAIMSTLFTINSDEK